MREWWLSAAFGGLGVLLMTAALVMALVNAVQAGQARTWERKLPSHSFVSFAWSELGRGLFVGYLLALGMSPLTAFFFLGETGFWYNFVFFTALVWALGAIVVYFATLLPGVVGFVRYQKRARSIGSLATFVQFLVVIVLSMPLAFVMVRFLLPPAHQVLTILVETARFHYMHLPA